MNERAKKRQNSTGNENKMKEDILRRPQEQNAQMFYRKCEGILEIGEDSKSAAKTGE